jgi:HAD superfamily hydrolase (TIGR01509 family)
MTLKALIFDVDGTLAETEELHRRAFNAAFAAAGLDWEWDSPLYKELLRTTGEKERIAAYQRDCLSGDPPLTWEDIVALHRAKTATYAALMAEGSLTLRPGVESLVREAREAGLKLAIATTTSYPNIEALCQACWSRPAGSLFDVIAAGDEVERKKPAPDVYELALTRLALPASACIAFEDSHPGLIAARAAGLRTIVTPGLYTWDHDFEGAAAKLPEMPELAEIPV